MVPLEKRIRRFDTVEIRCGAFSWVSSGVCGDAIASVPFLLSIDVWSSMPLALIVILVENDDEAVVLTIC